MEDEISPMDRYFESIPQNSKYAMQKHNTTEQSRAEQSRAEQLKSRQLQYSIDGRVTWIFPKHQYIQ
jgi:hypothetical protein